MAKRLKKNWGYMIRQGKMMNDIEKYKDNAKAVLEHMFNNHQYCNPQWCLALRAKDDEKTYIHPSGWLSCDDARQKKIYDQVKVVVDKYGGEFYLRQSMHPFNTDINEALNRAQAMLTPKAKVFHESLSFHYRHAIVVGSHN